VRRKEGRRGCCGIVGINSEEDWWIEVANWRGERRGMVEGGGLEPVTGTGADDSEG
jgi:hypothetical protein